MISINTIPNAGDLMYFRTICETQNLSRAAERLGIGQPALSLSLKRLEEGLGVPLMIRRARGLLPTPAGEALLKSSRVLLQEWEKLAQNVSQIQNEPSGKFVIGAHPSVAIYAGALSRHRHSPELFAKNKLHLCREFE
jgi:DNA-binding transcriptional LysR family regulator